MKEIAIVALYRSLSFAILMQSNYKFDNPKVINFQSLCSERVILTGKLLRLIFQKWDMVVFSIWDKCLHVRTFLCSCKIHYLVFDLCMLFAKVTAKNVLFLSGPVVRKNNM